MPRTKTTAALSAPSPEEMMARGARNPSAGGNKRGNGKKKATSTVAGPKSAPANSNAPVRRLLIN